MPRNCRGESRVQSREPRAKRLLALDSRPLTLDPKCTCQLRDAAERWLAAGKPNVSDAEAETRLAACKACQHWARYGERLALSIRMATLRCPLAKWDIRAIPRTQFVTTAQLIADTQRLVSRLPRDFDAVVSVARSGLLPATVAATELHLLLYTCGVLDQGGLVPPVGAGTERLHDLQGRLASPRTRCRDRAKVAEAVEKVLAECQVESWVLPRIEEEEEETFRQTGPGRPSPKTPFRRQVRKRFSLAWEIDHARMAEEPLSDGIFPLVTNDRELSERELLLAYKRQPHVEKRFAQLKSDYEVAPVYLKEVRRIQGLLCVYFLAQLLQALLERELRRAMVREQLDSLPLYPEGRPCRYPTTRKVIDLFEPVGRHTLTARGQQPTTLVTELTPLQRRILKLLGVPANTYGQ
jgi:hypothetical protein